ncbi:hypothetical protein HPB51_021562 [Rhipicephalus microplus]|uniref:Tick transposon n=1 Tax=Rhipicephalus microplus TaxID=6941 RepID=A0A9J6DCK7_RHIMP|nr:hypothetical protein HPB51_021562 [Rhipicephalus microplus]
MTAASQSVGPRLPTLSIKLFNGDVCRWTSFWEQLNGAVHTNPTLSTTDKFHYLCNYVVGDTAAAITDYRRMRRAISANQMLKQRFRDKSKIKQWHFGALRELNHVTSPSDIRDLHRLYDTLQLNVQCLNALDVPTNSFAVMLYDVMLQSLPQKSPSRSTTIDVSRMKHKAWKHLLQGMQP